MCPSDQRLRWRACVSALTLAGLALAPKMAASFTPQETTVPAGDSGTSRIDSKNERLRTDREGLLASVRAMEAADLSLPVLRASRTLLEQPTEKGYYALETCTLRESDVRFYVDWYRRDAHLEALSRATDFANKQHPVKVIARYARELEAVGVELFVVLMPLRIQVYPEWLPGLTAGDDFTGAGLEYARVLLALSEQGVEVIDTLPALVRARTATSEASDRDVFLRHNHHWTPRGMALVADLIAERVLALEGFEPGPAREGVDFSVERRLGTAAHARIKRSEPVWLQRVTTIDGEGGAHELDRESPLLLLGDSFVRYYDEEHSDLGSHLYARLGHRVDRIFNHGSGLGAWKTLARREDGVQGKRVVVWLCSSKSLIEPVGRTRSLFGD